MTSKLAELRKEAKLTQSDLAQSLGITQAQVSKYEKTGMIPIQFLKPWANTIGCTIEELLPSQSEKKEKVFNFNDSVYGELTEDLNLLLQYIDRFPQLKEELPDVSVSPTVDQFRARVVALKEKTWVVLTGHFDSGKSHFCNFYLGRKHLPTGYRPTTKYPTFVRHISDRPKWLKEDLWLMGPEFDPDKWHDKQHCTENCLLAGSWDTLEQHATLKGSTDNSDEGTVLAFVDAPLLHSCVLVDLPGYDDTMTNAAVIDKLGRRASILFYLCPATGFLDGGDFARLGHLLRALPRYEEIDATFPIFGNLFIVASQAHHGIKEEQLQKEILEGGGEAFYEHFKGNLLPQLSRPGQSISREDVATRFFSFYQEIPHRRQKLEQALDPLLGTQLPSIKARSVNDEILEFKKQGPAAYSQCISECEKLLKDKNEAKRYYEKRKNEEPSRKARHNKEVKKIEGEIAKFKDRDLENLRVVFKREMEVDKLEAMIKDRYEDKKDAQKHASAYVLENIQAKTQDIRRGLIDKTSNLVETFLKDYNVKIGKFSDAGIGEFSTFDATGAFVGGLASLTTLGALGAWASTLGNLGGYIIVAKGVSALSALGISFGVTGGTAGVTALVSALGGPITLAIGVAVAVGAFFGWLFGGSWQRRLAKKIKGVFDEKDVLPTIEGEVKSFWDDTLKAFRSAAKNLDEQCINQLKELEVAFAGSQEDIQKLRERLQRYEEIKNFFSAIPWQSREVL